MLRLSGAKVVNSIIIFYKRLFLINIAYLSLFIILLMFFDCYIPFYIFFIFMLANCVAMLITILNYIKFSLLFFQINNVMIAILANYFFSNGFGFELFIMLNISYCFIGNFTSKKTIYCISVFNAFIYLLLYYASVLDLYKAIYNANINKYRLYFNLFNVSFVCLSFIVALIFVRRNIIINIKNKQINQTLLQENITKDYLTGLYNRWGLMSELEKFHLRHNVNFALIDIDNFKYVNSSFGFECGDEFLIKSSTLLKKTFPNSLICRFSSEQFLVFNLNMNYQNFIDTCDEFRNYFKAFNFKLKDNFYRATVSIGCVSVEGEFSTLQLENIIAEINKNLYISKQHKDELNTSKM